MLPMEKTDALFLFAGPSSPYIEVLAYKRSPRYRRIFRDMNGLIVMFVSLDQLPI